MKIIIPLLILILTFNSYANSLCDLFDNDMNSLVSPGIPNCLNENSIFEENESREPGPICNLCKSNLNSRVSVPEDDKVRIRKEAYLKEMNSEFKKAMSRLLTDMVALRNIDSTNSSYTHSINKCSNTALQNGMRNCGSFQKDFLKSLNFEQMIPNEIANLVSRSPNVSNGILYRESQYNQCSVSDQTIIGLTPQLLENSITPELVEKIASSESTSIDELWNKIGNDNKRLLQNHPLMMAMAKNPLTLVNFFRGLRGISNKDQLKNRFKSALYTPQNGALIDQEIASRCEQVISNFTTKICSSDFNRGNISLGPFSNFERYNNDEEYPESELTGTESLLARNLTMLEFCEAPANGKLSLENDSQSMNNFLPQSTRAKTFKDFSSNQYLADFGGLKKKLCDFTRGTKCETKLECDLFDIYQKTLQPGTSEFRLANSPDSGMTNLLRSMVGNPTGLTSSTKDILIAEGILPQSNGQFVERPQIPERQPEYLAGVANGTITPNSSGATSVQSQLATNQRRNSQSQAQAQISQPNSANSAIPNDTQLAASSDDDTEALRRFEQGLDERLRRVEGQGPTIPSRAARNNRPQASRPDSSGSNSDNSQTAAFVPAPQADSSAQFTGGSSPVSTNVPEARLGQDTSRRGLADRQRNEALANMNGARTNPSATAEAGRSPASVEGQFQPESSLSLNVESTANLETVLSNNDRLKALIQEQRPFRFRLNNSLFDVQFKNGEYSVAFRSGANNGQILATRLQGIFNTSLRRSPSADRNATLESLQNSIRN